MSEHFFLGGFLAPHPPVIVPAVGKGREKEAQKTCDALEHLALRIAELRPETVVLVSPHAPVFNDYVFFYEPVKPKTVLAGALRQFGDTTMQTYLWDDALQACIIRSLRRLGIEAGSLEPIAMKRHSIEPSLDHGALVPLHFLSKHYNEFRLVVLAAAGIDLQQIFEAGRAIRQASEETGRRALLIASGDLSHKVNMESPYGACPEGERFDRQLMDLVATGDIKGILAIDHSLREKAAECGFRPIVLLCGAMDGLPLKAEVLSYEAPFGIGYGVASLLVEPSNRIVPSDTDNSSRRTESSPTSINPTSPSNEVHQIPSQVRLAKATLQAMIVDKHHLTLKEAEAPPDLLNTRAGVFVSLHKFGALRGCIGTIAPTTGSIAEEIIQNAISASTGDPRFDPVTPDELPFLVVNVDVLNPAELIRSKADLDPKRYGVIVEKGCNRGLLLPDLEGVDTVSQQLDIACRKGGINPSGEYNISRFTITRYAE